MKYENAYTESPVLLHKKRVMEFLYAKHAFNCPVLRLRRPILPRA